MMECVSDSTAGGGTGGVSCASDDECDLAAGEYCSPEMMECVSDSTGGDNDGPPTLEEIRRSARLSWRAVKPPRFVLLRCRPPWPMKTIR